MHFTGNPEGCEPSGEWVPGNISQLEHWSRRQSGPVTSELYSKVTQDSRDRFWCLKSIFLLVYGADQSDLMPWQMTTDAAVLLESSQASIMTAWVMDLIDPLPGRSHPVSLTRGCHGMSSAHTETHMFVFTVLLPKQFKDLINCRRFMLGKSGQPHCFSLKPQISPDCSWSLIFLSQQLLYWCQSSTVYSGGVGCYVKLLFHLGGP